MKKLYMDRLKKIANHLKKGKLGHKRFDFLELHVGFDKDEKRKKQNKGFCGSAGCAIGEFPLIFPRYFHFFNKCIHLKRECFFDLNFYIADFLGIDQDDCYHLFYPNRQLKKYGGKRLSKTATKKQVANNILDFIRYKQRNGK